MEKLEKFNAINEATCYWLGYQFKIGRERLIHEASLRYPIADTITAKGTEINKIYLEKGHPYFLDRYIDVIIYNKNYNKIPKENLIPSISEIYELKLAKQTTNTKYGGENQRVVDDILRLAYTHLNSKKDCYFLICGKYQDFKNYFIGDKTDPKTDSNNNLLIKEKKAPKSSKEIQDQWITKKSLYKNYFDFSIGNSKEFTSR